jgi:N-acetylglucosaminyldiphosphoundecaprenol N-acetyl-beta-D-mannosaminyltransferase
VRIIEFFGIKINPLTRDEFISIIESKLENGSQVVQNGVNAASIIEIVNNDFLKNAINNSDLVNIDGMSVYFALNFLGRRVPERVACPDLAEDILGLAEKNNYCLFLFGADDKSVRASKEKLIEKYPGLRIAGFRNGYFNREDEQEIVELINEANPDILFLGMPSPKKELFIEKYRDSLNFKYCLGVGGYFNILAGSTKRAPDWVQNIGMEWFYRLIQEPNRLWRRYMIGNTKFIWMVLKEKFGNRNS